MQNELSMTPSMSRYMQDLEVHVNRIYELARLAREQGLDPKREPEILLTKDLAARVEGVVGPPGVSKLIRELAEDLSREELTFKVAEEIVKGRFGKLSPQEAADQSLRTALSILTEGKTAAPLEGIGQIKIKQNKDGTDYLSIYYAGPIRAAGGTEAALTVIIGDFIRRLLQLDQYKPNEDEVERYVEEITLYARVCHLQIPTTPDEIRVAAQNLPIELTGEPTEKFEVGGYRDLERVETNRLRGGMALVLNDGVIGRAHKLLGLLDKVGLGEWEWLRNLKKTKEQKKTEGGESNGPNIEAALQPKLKYLRDVIAGRPVFSHPSRRGGFRLRYGHARNTGLAALGFHPATMLLTDEFLAIGTQVVTEKPGKGSIVCSIDSIEGPLVKLKNGDVLRVDTLELASQIRKNVAEILSLGDILIGFGEFLENNHRLIPAGYCPEWWVQEVFKGIRVHCDASLQITEKNTGIRVERLNDLLTKYYTIYPSEKEAIQLTNTLKIPLHPYYTYHWDSLTGEEICNLQKWFISAKLDVSPDNEELNRILITSSSREKHLLEELGIPHKVIKNQIEITEGALTLNKLLDLNCRSDKTIEQHLEADKINSNGINLVTSYSGINLREKGGSYIGGRMGRPEKSRERKMRPPVHGLFPIEMGGGTSRNIYAMKKEGKSLQIELIARICPNCTNKTHLPTCPECKVPTTPIKRCKYCGRTYGNSENSVCPACGGEIVIFEKRNMDITALLGEVRTKIHQLPPIIKGVKKLINPTKEPEALEKVILRAIHDVYVYKDGTIRYDATDAPLTHFYPNEIGVDVETIKNLGYTHDLYGNPIINPTQCIELKPQDIVISNHSASYLLQVTRFINDLLTKVYQLEPFYESSTKHDLIGHLVIGLAPHTSCGIIGRIIGFTPARVHFAHPYWHAAKRRNCIIGTEEVPIWDSEKNKLICQPISELVEESIHNGATQEVVDDFGTIAVENLHPHWQVMSIDEQTKAPILQPIKHWIKGQHHQWISIRTETGRTLKMTPQHTALVWNSHSKTITKTKAMYLKIGDQIPILTKPPLPIQHPPERINILKELADNLPDNEKFQTFKHQVRLRGAANWMRTKILQYAHTHDAFNLTKSYKRLQPQVRSYFIRLLPQKPLKNLLTTVWFNSIPLSHLEVLQQEGIFQWEEIPADATLGMARDDHTVRPYIPFTTNLMRLLGYLIAEGYIRDDYTCYQTNFSVPNADLRTHVKQLINEILGSAPYYNQDNHQLVHTGRIHAYLFAYAWKIGKTALTKRMPKYVFSLPKEYKYAFLSAFIDGDGSIPSTDKAIIFYSASQELLQDIGFLLNTLGVFYRNRKQSPVGHYGNKVLERYKALGKPPKDSIVYRISIRGSDLWLLKRLELYHNDKRKNAKKIINEGFSDERIVRFRDGTYHSLEEHSGLIFDPITEIQITNENAPSYCLEVEILDKMNDYNNFSTLGCFTSNCDGDEDSFILLLDGLLNFSRAYLPTTRGGMMDTPLVLSTILDPNEVDSESHNIDVGASYPPEFYERTWQLAHPEEVVKLLDIIEHRLGTEAQYEGFQFTHPTSKIDKGPLESAYIKFESMKDKVQAQLRVAEKVKAADVGDTAQRIINQHLIRDLIGCLRAYGTQSFRCTKCNAKYRRIPLTGTGCSRCGGNIILNMSEGSATKYYELSTQLINKYHLPDYLRDRLELIGLNIAQLFRVQPDKHLDLAEFL